jgi:hypothetical protein
MSTERKEKSPPTLVETLDDPHLLSCFVDYMDKDDRLPYLQLYMILSGIEDQVGQLVNSEGDSWIGQADPLLIEDLKRLSNEFLSGESVFIDINSKLAADFQNCIQKLDTTKSLNSQSLEWLKFLKNVKSDVLRQMELDYGMFVKSATFENFKGNLDFDDEEDIEKHRSLLEDKEKFNKFIRRSSFFKKSKKKPVDNAPPSRKDGVENVEGELQSIISSEETVFGRIKHGLSSKGRSRKSTYNGASSDSDTNVPAQSGHRRKFSITGSILKMLPRSTAEPFVKASDNPASSLASSQSLIGIPAIENARKDESLNRKISQLEQELAYLEEEISAMKKEDVDSKAERQLLLMKRGLQAELQQALTEKSLLEVEIPDSIFKVFQFQLIFRAE